MEKSKKVENPNKEEALDISKMKKEKEKAYIDTVNKLGILQKEGEKLLLEKTRLEGELRLLEKLEKEDKK